MARRAGIPHNSRSPGAFEAPFRVTDDAGKPETLLYVLTGSIPQSRSEGAFTKQAKRCASLQSGRDGCPESSAASIVGLDRDGRLPAESRHGFCADCHSKRIHSPVAVFPHNRTHLFPIAPESPALRKYSCGEATCRITRTPLRCLLIKPNSYKSEMATIRPGDVEAFRSCGLPHFSYPHFEPVSRAFRFDCKPGDVRKLRAGSYSACLLHRIYS